MSGLRGFDGFGDIFRLHDDPLARRWDARWDASQREQAEQDAHAQFQQAQAELDAFMRQYEVQLQAKLRKVTAAASWLGTVAYFRAVADAEGKNATTAA